MTRWALDGRPCSGAEVRLVTAPIEESEGGFDGGRLSRRQFEQACRWTKTFVDETGRLPSRVWFGVESLPIDRFAATLAGDLASGSPGAAQVPVVRAKCGFCERVTTDPRSSFSWVIHPKSFRAPRILELTRLLAWSMKPAAPAGR